MAVQKVPPIAQPRVEVSCPPIGDQRLSARDAERLSRQLAGQARMRPAPCASGSCPAPARAAEPALVSGPVPVRDQARQRIWT
jgi:hypothetical protein